MGKQRGVKFFSYINFWTRIIIMLKILDHWSQNMVDQERTNPPPFFFLSCSFKSDKVNNDDRLDEISLLHRLLWKEVALSLQRETSLHYLDAHSPICICFCILSTQVSVYILNLIPIKILKEGLILPVKVPLSSSDDFKSSQEQSCDSVIHMLKTWVQNCL